MSDTYYVYALKDPRERPAKVFYIGKGTGARASNHINKLDETRKGKYIRDMLSQGYTPITSCIVDNLSEELAFKIELELIASFGTVDSGGTLLNTVMPLTVTRKVDKNVTVPIGAMEKAQIGLQLLKDAITMLTEENPEGVTNADCAHYLGLQSDNKGRQQDYLTYSILGLLLKNGTLVSQRIGSRRKYMKI